MIGQFRKLCRFPPERFNSSWLTWELETCPTDQHLGEDHRNVAQERKTNPYVTTSYLCLIEQWKGISL